jgi:hypothetical protein
MTYHQHLPVFTLVCSRQEARTASQRPVRRIPRAAAAAAAAAIAADVCDEDMALRRAELDGRTHRDEVFGSRRAQRLTFIWLPIHSDPGA